MSPPERRLRVRQEVIEVLRGDRTILPARALNDVINQISDEVVGLGPLERLLKDPEVSEVLLTMAYIPPTIRGDQDEGGDVKAVGYVRLSKADADSTSPQRQRQSIEKLCAERGWELVDVFEDLDVSGSSSKRTGLDRMLAQLGHVDAIVFWRLDRLYRSIVGMADVVRATKAAEVALVSATEPFDTSTPMGEAMLWLIATFAQLEIRVMGERSKNMHAYLKANGRWASRVPFGWRKASNGRLEPFAPEQATLQAMAESFGRGLSLREIGRAVGMEHTSVRHMLRSEMVMDALPPELADGIRQELSDRENGHRAGPKSLLAGLARCGECGGPLKLFGRRQNGNGDKVWAAYGCRERGHVYISQPWLDAYVSTEVLALIDKPKLARKTAGRTPRAPKTAELEARLDILERDYYERGIVSREAYLRRREGLLERMEAAKEAPAPSRSLPRDLALHLDERWEELTVAEQRRIIATVLDAVEVGKGRARNRAVDPARVRLLRHS